MYNSLTSADSFWSYIPIIASFCEILFLEPNFKLLCDVTVCFFVDFGIPYCRSFAFIFFTTNYVLEFYVLFCNHGWGYFKTLRLKNFIERAVVFQRYYEHNYNPIEIGISPRIYISA